MPWITLNLCRRKSILQQVISAKDRLLEVMYLKTKYDHVNSGFRLFKDLKTLHMKARVSHELKLYCYPEEAHHSFCHCYIHL